MMFFSAFVAFMFWLLAMWLVWEFTHKPLTQKIEHELADIDVEDRQFQSALKEAAWLDRPVINLRLSRKWVK